MSPAHREAHVEHLIGRRVRDLNGRVIGRLEELRVDDVDGETVVVEFLIGPEALVERLGGAALKLPFLNRIAQSRREYRVPWQDMDLDDPDRPTVRAAVIG